MNIPESHLRTLALLFFISLGFVKALAIELEKQPRVADLNQVVTEKINTNASESLSLANDALAAAVNAGLYSEQATALKNLGLIHYQLGNFRQSQEYFEQALIIFNKLKDKEGAAGVNNNIGLIFEIQGDYSGALKKYMDAAATFEKIKNNRKTALAYTNIGNVYYTLGRYDKALDYHSQSLRMSENTGDSLGMAKAYNNIGNIYLSLKDFNRAVDYYKRSVYINNKFDVPHSLSTCYTNLGAAYQGLGRINDALEYNRLSIEISRKINDHSGIIFSLLNIGEIYEEQGNLPQAELNFKEAMRLSQSVDDGYLNASVLTNMASLRIRQNELDEAINLLNEALKFGERTGAGVLLAEIYDHLAMAWQKKGNFKRAYEFLSKQQTIADSLYNNGSNDRLNRLRVSFESEQTERDNQLLRQQNIFSSLALKRQQTIRNLLIAISVIILVFASFLYSLYQTKNLKNELLAERNKQIMMQKEELNKLYKDQFKLNETKNKFFSIVAHDLKSPFQSILGFSELLSSEYEYMTDMQRREAAHTILNVSNDTFRLIENLLEWGRTQTGAVRAVFRSFNLREAVMETTPLFQGQIKKKSIHLTYDIPPLLQAWADQDMIMTVLRNLLSNAIKFTPVGGSIHISAFFTNEMVQLSVKDNGTGMPPEIIERLFTFDPKVQRTGTMGERGTGLGLNLCLEFMELNKGKILVESEPDQGSTFTMLMQPLSKRTNR